MKKMTFTLLLCFCSLLGRSQTTIQIFGGTTNAYYLSSIQNMGFNAGALIDIKFKEKWSFQTGLNVNSYTKEANYNQNYYFSESGITKFYNEGWISKFNYLEVPIAVSSKIKLKTDMHLVFNAGGYLAMFRGGQKILRSSDASVGYAIVSTNAENVHLGFLLGTGIEINKVCIGFESNFNVTDGLAAETLIKTKFGLRF